MNASDSYDFVVIGAGAAGCVLANRLSASGRHSVLLLEAGGEDSSPWIHIPLGYGKHFTNPAVNWLYSSEPQAGAANRRIAQPRGKVLGGSTSINGLLYIRGQHEDYDRWRDLGNAGWGYADVLPYFRKSEDQQRGADEYHGTGGPLSVSDPPEPHPLADAYLAAAEECGYRRNPDFNGATQEGFGYNQWTIRRGFRSSAATGYLRPARRRANLRVITRAHATRILFSGKRATGVEYLRDGIPGSATARVEVLVAGGSFNSPQLLQLSGVGPASLSQRFGIGVVADLPGVGMNLQDHYTARMVYECTEPFTLNDVVGSFPKSVVAALRFAFLRKGFLAMGQSYATGFIRADPAAATPDIQTSITLFSADKAGDKLHRFPGFTLAARLLRPESRGSVHDPERRSAAAARDRAQLPHVRKGLRGPAGGDQGDAAPDGDRRDAPLCRARARSRPRVHERRGPHGFSARRAAGSRSIPVGTCKMGSDACGGRRRAPARARAAGAARGGCLHHADRSCPATPTRRPS